MSREPGEGKVEQGTINSVLTRAAGNFYLADSAAELMERIDLADLELREELTRAITTLYKIKKIEGQRIDESIGINLNKK